MDAGTLLAILLGAAISLASSLLIFGLGVWADRRKREQERRADAAVAAFRASMKLLDAYNELANIHHLMTEMFSDASKQGMDKLEPATIYKPIAGQQYQLEPILSDETSFLIRSGNTDLINDVFLAHRRASNIIQTIDTINNLRTNFTNHLMANSVETEIGEGTLVNTVLSGRNAKVAELMISQLNNLIGRVFEMLEVDEANTLAVAKKFVEAARTHFGEDFPKFKVLSVTEAALAVQTRSR